MSAPTGYEAGGARTLQKIIVYTEEVAPEESPAQANVFYYTRTAAGVPTSTYTAPTRITTVFDIEGYVILDPVWGGPPVFRLIKK